MQNQLRSITRFAAALAAVLIGPTAWAQTAPVQIEGAWARASVQGQMATGAFMRLRAKDGARLLRAESPAAGFTELHEMKFDGGIMKMRAIGALELPAGKTVELKPGGQHIMLMDLKAPLMKGGAAPISLVFEDARGAQTQLDLNLPVHSSAPEGASDGHRH